MKSFFFILLSISLLCSYGRRYNEPLNNQISSYIQRNCQEKQPCKIQLKDATDFSWDKFIFFDIPVEPEVISALIGEEFSSASPYYSRKWFFLKDNKVIRSEEQILYEIDVPMKNGDVDFDLEGGERIKIEFAESNFALFQANSIFEIERNDTGTVQYYRLHCINCQ
ncbi:MAG: hypothetical protein LH614_08190 [Pyrinomonadaceae bacterium]|nr:hypothetical protein [Pyrinomonadaceae bacterium]